MNTGQMLLTLGALMLISLTILNFNANLADIDDSLNDNRFRLEALSILTSHIEEAGQFFFDEVTTDTLTEATLANMTSSNDLGWDSNDAGVVDDIDDLSGSTVQDTGKSGVVYNVMYEVEYVTLSSNVLTATSSNTYHKRITIDITDTMNPPLLWRTDAGTTVRDTLSMSFVISYWFYN
jgi:hypothetical protein